MNSVYKKFTFSNIMAAHNLLEYILKNNSKIKELSKIIGQECYEGSCNFNTQKKSIDYIQDLLKLDIEKYSISVALLLLELHPHDFEIATCPICCIQNWQVDYCSDRFLSSAIYPGAPDFPIFARGVLPLIYGHCKNCGCGEIVVRPKQYWIDIHIQPEGHYGKWMESDVYIQEKTNHSETHYHKAELDKYRSKKSCVIEISPGSGVFLSLLKNKYHWDHCIGIEPDGFAAEIARKKYSLNVINEYFYFKRDLTNYDLVIFDNALEHHSMPRFALDIARTSLSNGKALFIVVPNYHSYAVEFLKGQYFNMNWGHWHYFTIQSLCQLVQQSGFEIKKTYCSFLEPSIKDRLISEDLSNFEVDPQIAIKFPPHKKLLRGEFLYLVAEKK